MKEIKVGQLVYDSLNKRLGQITDIRQALNIYDNAEPMYDVLWMDAGRLWNEYPMPYFEQEVYEFMNGLNEYMRENG